MRSGSVLLAAAVFMGAVEADAAMRHCGPNNVAANLTGKPADGGKDVGSLAAYSYVIRDVK